MNTIDEIRIERWNRFVESEEWKVFTDYLQKELNRNIVGVRSTARVSGKEKECAGFCGAADALEFVGQLPEIIKKNLKNSLAKGDKNA